MSSPSLSQSLEKSSIHLFLEDECLRVEEFHPRVTRSSVIALSDLDEEPVFQKASAPMPVFETLAFAGIGVMFLVGGLLCLIAWIAERPSTFESWISPPFAVAAGSGVIYFSIKRVNAVERMNRGKFMFFRLDDPTSAVIRLDDRLPSPELVGTFIQQLKEAIRAARERRRAMGEVSPETAEWLQLAHLVKTGALTEAELTLIKSRMLAS